MSLESGFSRGLQKVKGTKKNVDESSNVDVESNGKNELKKCKSSSLSGIGLLNYILIQYFFSFLFGGLSYHSSHQLNLVYMR